MAIDPNIKQKAENIRLKKKGREVRESLAAGLEAMSEDVVSTVARQGNVESQFQEVIDNTTGKDVISAPELIAARNGEANLKARLDKEQQQVNAQLAQTNEQLGLKPNKFETMSKVDFDSWIATLLNGRASIFSETLASLKEKYPDGAAGVALVRETNPPKIYVWTGTEWSFYGDYTGIEPQDHSILGSMIKQDPMDLKKLNYTEGTIWDGAIVVGEKNAALLDYYFLPQGTVIEANDQIEYKLYRYDDAKNWVDATNPNWTTKKTEIEQSCLVRWVVRFKNENDFVEPTSLGSLLYIYKTPQMDFLEKELKKVQSEKITANKMDTGFLQNIFDVTTGQNIKWELGTIGPTGSNAESNTRMRTGYVRVKKGTTIETINIDRYKFGVYYYDDSATLIETTGFMQQRKYTVVRDGLIRILHAKTTDGVLVDYDDPANKYSFFIINEKKDIKKDAFGIDDQLLAATLNVTTEKEVQWVFGSISSVGGNVAGDTRMRTDFIPVKKGSKVKSLDPTTFKWGAFVYDKSYTIVDTKSLDTDKEKVINHDGYLRMTFAYRSNKTIEPSLNPSDYMQITILQEKEDSDVIYVKEYLPEIEKTKHDYRRDYSKDRFGFIFITDLHVDTISQYNMAMRQLRAVSEIAKTTDISAVIVGGDLHSGNLSSKEATKQRMEDVLQGLHEIGKPILVARGNHDDNSFYYTGSESQWGNTIPLNNLITPTEWNSFALSPYINGKVIDEERESTYFYQDFTERKTRVIVLDWIDYGFPKDTDGDGNADKATTGYGHNGFSEEQVKWFAETLLDTPKNYNAIIITHGPTRGELNNAGYTPVFAATVNDMMDAFNKKLTNSYGGVDYDFGAGGREGKIIGLFYGHIHGDKVTAFEDVGNIPMVATGCSLFRTGEAANPIPGYDYQPNREKSKITEALFDVISVKDSGVKAIRFGSGEDRVI